MSEDPALYTLPELCDAIVQGSSSFGDLLDYIQDTIYDEAEKRGVHKTVKLLQNVVNYLEKIEDKTDETCRDLSELYNLIGELYQQGGDFGQSVQWFEKAILVDDHSDVAYHHLATSYIRMGDSEQAIRCLEQEIHVAPGNYFAYYVLADIYERIGEHEKFVQTLELLLERNPANIRALHRLICHYETQTPEVDVELLRRRLINTKANLSKRELAIWTFHMCKENKLEAALHYLDIRLGEKPDFGIIHLLSAFIYGRQRQYRKAAGALSRLVAQCRERKDLLRSHLDEFAAVFGQKAARPFVRKLGLAGE